MINQISSNLEDVAINPNSEVMATINTVAFHQQY